MFANWWTLPGPRKYVDTIEHEIRQGKNIIISFPTRIDSALVYGIRDKVNETKRYKWNKISPNNTKPINYLFDTYFDENTQFVEKKIKNLWDSSSFEAQVFYLENLPEGCTDNWVAFLVDYQHYLQNVDLISRTLFVIPVFGEASLKLPNSDNCLTVLRFQDIISELDLELFFYYNIIANPISKPVLINKLICSILTQIGNDDIEFCKYLLSFPPRDIFKPIEILKQFGRCNKWERFKYTAIEDLKREEESKYLSIGILHIKEGKLCYHSAFLALYDKNPEIERRIWTGQVKIIFPFIEIIRQQLLTKLKDAGILTVPHRKKIPTGYIEILNYYDLEIGDILYQLNSSINRKHNIYSKIYGLVEAIKEMRDGISHLTPISFEMVNRDEIIRHEEIINSL